MTHTTRKTRWPSSRGPPTHHPHQSHFFFRSYEANLPTSLNDVLFLTRGFLPRRPAAVMGTAFRPVICHLSPLPSPPPAPRGGRQGKGEKKVRWRFTGRVCSAGGRRRRPPWGAAGAHSSLWYPLLLGAEPFRRGRVSNRAAFRMYRVNKTREPLP